MGEKLKKKLNKNKELITQDLLSFVIGPNKINENNMIHSLLKLDKKDVSVISINDIKVDGDNHKEIILKIINDMELYVKWHDKKTSQPKDFNKYKAATLKKINFGEIMLYFDTKTLENKECQGNDLNEIKEILKKNNETFEKYSLEVAELKKKKVNEFDKLKKKYIEIFEYNVKDFNVSDFRNKYQEFDDEYQIFNYDIANHINKLNIYKKDFEDFEEECEEQILKIIEKIKKQRDDEDNENATIAVAIASLNAEAAEAENEEEEKEDKKTNR